MVRPRTIPPALEQAVRERLGVLEQTLARHRRGGASDDELRAARLALCVHQQADPERFMLRIRVPAGQTSAEHLEAIAGLARAGARTRPVHLTTRQCLQVHALALDEAPEAIRFLLDRDLATAGTCGNSVRNVAACERSGLCTDEVADAGAVARALSDALAVYPDHALPRKFKVAVSGCPRDCAGSILQDAGWVARRAPDRGGVTFDLWGGGGLGARPREAVLLAQGVREGQVVEVTRALIDLFDREGDRTNRKRARLKFLVQRLGAVELRARLGTSTGAGSDSPPACTACREPDAPTTTASGDRWSLTNVTAERRPGRTTCAVTIPDGELSAGQLDALAAAARTCGDGTVRLTPDQNLLIPGVAAERMPDVRRALCTHGLGQPGAGWAGDPVCCPGQDVCGLAFAPAREAARAIRERLAREPALVDRLGRCAVRVSGCPNGCARHATAAVGVQGMRRGGEDCYRLWIGSADPLRHLARPMPGSVLAADLADGVVAALRARADRASRDPVA